MATILLEENMFCLKMAKKALIKSDPRITNLNKTHQDEKDLENILMMKIEDLQGQAGWSFNNIENWDKAMEVLTMFDEKIQKLQKELESCKVKETENALRRGIISTCVNPNCTKCNGEGYHPDNAILGWLSWYSPGPPRGDVFCNCMKVPS